MLFRLKNQKLLAKKARLDIIHAAELSADMRAMIRYVYIMSKSVGCVVLIKSTKDEATLKKLKSFLLILGTFSLTLMLSGCKIAMLDTAGRIAHSEKELMIYSTVLMLLIVVPVILMTFWFAWKYRASNPNADYRPEEYDNVKIEIFCWVVPCLIVIILGVITWISSHRLDPYRPISGLKGKTITIQVVSLNWKWLFIYPKQGIAAVNYIQIPPNRQVKFLITSDAPMNSLEIPRLAGQVFAMGGMQTKLHIVADKPGVYKGFSANISGIGFSGMRFKVHVTSEKAFANWVKKTQHAPEHLTAPAYNKLMQNSEDNPVAFYSHVAKNLYHNVIMKYLKPNVKGMYTMEEQNTKKGN